MEEILGWEIKEMYRNLIILLSISFLSLYKARFKSYGSKCRNREPEKLLFPGNGSRRLFFRKLGQDNGAENQRAADVLADGQQFMQEQCAGQRAEYGFQAEDKRCLRCRGVFLSDDLQDVCDSCGEHASVDDR